MNIRITDSKDLQQQSTTRPAETNNADVFSQTLQQVQYAQVKPATQVAGISAAEIKTDASKQSNEAKRSVLDEFMDWMQMSDAEKIRDRILKGMGLTEEDLENMEPEDREKIEEMIAQQIKDQTEIQIERQLAGDAT
ncbi:hypothetical protein [Denitrificimonas caeni]|uniref:Uncharacterized protein n=1 Tax=Denitrificimonas caeni TaxID=521720 RepID=A0AAF0AK95_9GAMM|nr:hypothetical protein [Denitrificimonas caeni]WBE24253.1 hypothetical protein O6P33_07640 [Denitrificimonas caeni]